MHQENDKKQFHILLVDDDKEFNDKLQYNFIQLEQTCIQAFNSVTANQYIQKHKDDLDLVILSTELKDGSFEYFKKELLKYSHINIILVANYDNIALREHSFKEGILDFHLKSSNIFYIADDILEYMKRIQKNHTETILIIDDSKIICKSLEKVLKVRNFQVFTALDGRSGINIIKENPISILILDLELPDINGIDILVGLRDLFMINDFPILVLSSSSNPAVIRQALKKGSSDFIRKPVRFEEFLLKIDRWTKTSIWQRTIKEQKNEIENSLQSFQSLVNSTIEAIFIFHNETCVDVNDGALKLLKISKKEDILENKLLEIFSNLPSQDKQQLTNNNIDCFFESTLQDSQHNYLNVQIKEKNLELKKTRLKIIAVVDITEVKHNEKMLSHQTKMASMGEMIGNIAHQWRQPLTAISVAAGGIKLNYELDIADISETMLELDNIIDNTQFLSNTIEDFQSFLKNNKSKGHFTIKDTINRTLSIIKGNLVSSEIILIKDYDQYIQINSVQNDLIQVLLNIINNSVDVLKTIQNQKKVISIFSSVDNDFITITLQDNAGGIPEEIINNIFDPYFTTKHQTQGTGLGLYMTHQIVENLQGSIIATNIKLSYENKEFTGAQFKIKLPISLIS